MLTKSVVNATVLAHDMSSFGQNPPDTVRTQKARVATEKGLLMRHRLTDSTVRKLDSPEKGNRIYYDTLVDGFGLRVTANGARSFILNYRTKATRLERRYTIGDIDTWSAVKARDHARELKQGVDAGKDPLEEIEKERAARRSPSWPSAMSRSTSRASASALRSRTSGCCPSSSRSSAAIRWPPSATPTWTPCTER